MGRWWGLRDALAMRTAVLARQVHGAAVLRHEDTPDGLLLTPPADGHVTDRAGILLAVTVADCVPVFVVSPRPRAIALLHAGWRGTAAGILPAGIAALSAFADAATLRVHLGPSVCGACYEVGPEVHAALGLPDPGRPTPVDLREVLRRQAEAAGVPASGITTSSWCTLHDDAFHSYRRGDSGRQIGVLAIRP